MSGIDNCQIFGKKTLVCRQSHCHTLRMLKRIHRKVHITVVETWTYTWDNNTVIEDMSYVVQVQVETVEFEPSKVWDESSGRPEIQGASGAHHVEIRR